MENNVGHIVYQHQAALRKFLTGLCLFAIVQYKDPSNFSHILFANQYQISYLKIPIFVNFVVFFFYFMIYSLTISAPVKQLI